MKVPTAHNGGGSGRGSGSGAGPWALANWRRWLAGRSQAGVLVIGLGLITLIGILDYVTGPQISSSLFYLLPVLLVAHFGGAFSGVTAGCAASAAWLLADLASPMIYDHPFIPYWNALMRLGVFLVAVWLVSAMGTLNVKLEARVRERTEALVAEVRERRNLEKRVLEISDREQARIGQDLHDGLCQHLVSTAFSANLLHEKLAAQGRTEAEAANQVALQLDDSITQARRLARGLYAIRVDANGLARALEDLAIHTTNRSGVACSLVPNGTVQLPDTATAIHLYRIAQEAVANAVKHAKARRVVIGLCATGTQVRLTIEDDGTGIPARNPNPEGMGLSIMRYRARMIGATFEIEPATPGGTRITCRLEQNLVPN
jgi:signal transduction histidine kinase